MNPAPRRDTAEGKKRSPDVARFLTVRWDLGSLEGRSAYGEADLPFSSLATSGAPMLSEDGETAAPPTLVYIPNPKVSEKREEELEDLMFGHDDLAVASHVIRFVRLDVEELSESDRAEYAKKLPAFVMMDGRGEVIAKTKGLQRPTSLLRGLAKLYKSQYSGSLNRRIVQVDKVLKEIEKLEDKIFYARLDLDALRKRHQAKPKPKLARNIAKAEKEYASQQAALQALRDKRTKGVTPELSKRFLKLLAKADD